MTKIEAADRIQQLPPYLFAEIDRLKAEARKQGKDIIDLGVGDPDLPTFERIRAAMKKAVDDPANHRYPSYTGMNQFRETVAAWYQKRFGVTLDPLTETLTLIGSKEGISNIHLALVNPGEVVLVPDPGYPVYASGTLFAGGEVFRMPLLEANDYFPDFSKIPADICKRAKLMHLNYPNNPTAAVANRAFYEKAVAFARERNILICSDLAYSEIYYGNERPLSILEIPGAKDLAIEFHSLSKTYNMTGWRIGMAVGNREMVNALGKIKTNLDSGQFQAVQIAGIEALTYCDRDVEALRKIYTERRDAFCSWLTKSGLTFRPLKAAFYIWVRVPEGSTSKNFAMELLQETGIVGTPGTGFGASGEGYIRFTLCAERARLEEAGKRLAEFVAKRGR